MEKPEKRPENPPKPPKMAKKGLPGKWPATPHFKASETRFLKIGVFRGFSGFFGGFWGVFGRAIWPAISGAGQGEGRGLRRLRWPPEIGRLRVRDLGEEMAKMAKFATAPFDENEVLLEGLIEGKK